MCCSIKPLRLFHNKYDVSAVYVVLRLDLGQAKLHMIVHLEVHFMYVHKTTVHAAQ